MLASLLEAAASLAPDRAVLSDDNGAITLTDFHGRALVGAQDFRGHDAIILLINTGPALPLALFASSIAGVPLVPLNYRLTDAALAQLIARFEHPLIVADAENQHRVPTDLTVEEWMMRASAGAAEQHARPESAAESDLAVILFTSGTTSAPKAVPLSQANLGSYLINSIELAGAAADDIALVCVPPYHVAGVMSALSNVISGRRVEYLSNFDPQRWLSIVRDRGVTTAMVVPTMLKRIVDSLDGQPADTPTLVHLAYGGARIAPDTLQRAITAFPSTGFTNAYGLTETSSTLAVLSPDDHREAVASSDAAVRRRLESVGRPVPGIEFDVRDDDGKTVGADAVGTLWVRGAQVSGHYLGTGSALDDGGWFNTHDSAMIDAAGYIYIRGRSDDTIIRGAENIAPAEIEDVLMQHPRVSDVAVMGAPDPDWGEKTVAVVVAKGEISRDEVRDFARARLRSSRTPDDVIFVGELPYNATGKLVRSELLGLYLVDTRVKGNR